jgi:mannose-6-phosphate isomerase-like protein (cupin superfamily)
MSAFREVTRPWGNYKLLIKEDGFEVKRLEINPGARFSLQKHLKRAEAWTIARGDGVATVGTSTIRVRAGSIVEIQIGQLHRLQNTGTTPLIFIEVQLGDELDEKDIVHLEDDFGRA